MTLPPVDGVSPDNATLTPPSLWYTMESGRQAGPWSLSALHERRRAGLIPADCLVWSDPMTEWVPYQGVFSTPLSPGSESPKETAAAMVSDQAAKAAAERLEGRDPSAHPWHRWFARLLDLYMLAIVSGFVIGLVGSSVPTSDIVWAILSPALLALIEPLFLSKWGATPGKQLLNIQVTESDGARLTLSRAFARSWKTWSVGMGFGIPLVSLFTLSRQHSHLRKEGVASYDASLGTRVTHGPVGARRALGIAVVGATMISLIALGASK